MTAQYFHGLGDPDHCEYLYDRKKRKLYVLRAYEREYEEENIVDIFNVDDYEDLKYSTGSYTGASRELKAGCWLVESLDKEEYERILASWIPYFL